LEKEKLKTQNALEFRSRFLSNMSHEIRTPLNGIIGMTHVAQKTELDDKQRDIIGRIESSSDILLGIINDILDISKIEAGKMSIEHADFNLESLIKTLESIFNVKAVEKNIDLITEYHKIENFNFIGDSLRISQVINNLVSNAIKFTQSGAVTISITAVDTKSIRFDVKDSGIGLKPEQIETLFEEFTQADMSTSRKYGGTGLGLSISKKLVKLMKGEIWVESDYGKGSTFSFKLPLEVNKNLKNSVTDKVDFDALELRVNALEGMKILVAEDNKMNQMVLSMLVEDTQLELDFADDGLIAVEKFKNSKYDLILMDVQMPNMNGYDATEAIKVINSDAVIVGLSVNVMQEDVTKAMNSGMDDYLAKPIEVEKLYGVLVKYLT
jgi:CheY-like chemotaxis protein